MGLVEDVGTFLAAQSTRFTLGTNLFLNLLPDEPNRATSLIETGGVAPNRIFGSTTPAWENARIQLASRSTSSTQARADADAAWTILEGVSNSTLSGSTYLRISAVQSVFLLERDERARPVFASNFDVQRRP